MPAAAVGRGSTERRTILLARAGLWRHPELLIGALGCFGALAWPLTSPLRTLRELPEPSE